MEIDDEKMEQALRYRHDLGFDEGYEVGYDEGWEHGYQIGYDEGVDSMEVGDADKRWDDEQQQG